MGAAGTAEAAVEATPKLQFRILGPLEVSRDGAVVDLGARKQRAVLALLLLNANRVVPTERLIDELWGDTPPETARSALQVYVAALRKALGGEGSALRTSAPGYVLDVEPGALDLDRFVALRAEAQAADDEERRSELLREALELWRDTPLADLSAEPFAATAVARLEELRLEALEQRIDADLALGRHAVARSGARGARRRAALSGAVARPAHAGALPLRATGRRARRLSDGPPHARRRARARAGPGAARARGRDPASRRPTVPRRLGRVGHRGAPVERAASTPSSARRRGDRCWSVPRSGARCCSLLLRDGSTAVTVPPDSVAAIDPRTNDDVAVVPVGPQPGPIADGAGSLWVGNLEGRTLTRIDPRDGRILGTIPLPATPTGDRRRVRRRVGRPRPQRAALARRSDVRPA